MKNTVRTLIFFVLVLVSLSSSAQKDWYCGINFETPSALCEYDTLFIDTLGNSGNVWRIGKPEKPVFDTAFSAPNAILTLLDTCYPINDTSSFTILHSTEAAMFYYSSMWIEANYRVYSDTLTDYGFIEFSPDNGSTWINLMTDTVISIDWGGPKPIFSGDSKGWKHFDIFINLYPYYNFNWGDTVLWRFTFISDSIPGCKDGWMLDDFVLIDFVEGVTENNCPLISSTAFPNPASSNVHFNFSGKALENAYLYISDLWGRTLYTVTNIQEPEVQLNIEGLKPGMYFYRITDGLRRGGGRFLVE